jgi:hypothetical protein
MDKSILNMSANDRLSVSGVLSRHPHAASSIALNLACCDELHEGHLYAKTAFCVSHPSKKGVRLLSGWRSVIFFCRTSAITDHHLLSAPKPAPQATCRKCRRHGGSVHGPVRIFAFVVQCDVASRLRCHGLAFPVKDRISNHTMLDLEVFSLGYFATTIAVSWRNIEIRPHLLECNKTMHTGNHDIRDIGNILLRQQ